MAITENFTIISNEFIDEIPLFSTAAVRIYLYFRRSVNEKKNGNNHVWPSYEKITKYTGVYRNGISKAIIELVEHGWLEEVNSEKNKVNIYSVADKKRHPDEKLLQERLNNKKINSERMLKKNASKE